VKGNNLNREDRKIFFAVVLLGLELVSSLADATQIQAFGLSTHPFMNATPQTRICYVDLYQTTMNVINAQLKQEGTVNAKKIQQQFGQQFSAIGKDFQCLYQAKQLGITFVPAIVFNGHFVIYGEVNMDFALEDYPNDGANR